MGGTKLTENDYIMIRERLNTFSPTTTAKMTNRGYSTIMQIKNSKNWTDYRVRYWKNFKKPTLWDKVKGIFTIHEK